MLRPYNCDVLLRRDLHVDVPRLRFFDLRQRHRQHAVLVCRLDGVGVDRRGQREAPLERAIGPFVAVHPLGALFGDLLLAPVNRKDVVLERDLHVLRFHARHLGHDPNGVGLLEDVHRRYPGRACAVAVLPVEVAERVAEETTDPALEGGPVQRGPSRVKSRDEHKQTSYEGRGAGLIPPGRRATGVPRDGVRGLPRWQAGLPRLRWFARMTELSFSLVCARLFVNRHVPVWVALGVWLGGVAAGAAPGYRILVSSESGDIVSQLTWDGVALKTVKVVPVGIMPADIDGPHNVTVSPDGKYWYVTIAHGTPYGTLWKMAVDGDTLVGKAPVEMFPTTISLTPDGELAFVANSDFHGDHPRMNVVSIVYTPRMITLTNLPACDMPHGVKVNHAGTKVYVTCMNSDEVLEIDRPSLAITRRHRTGEGMLPQAMQIQMVHGGAPGAGRGGDGAR